MNIFEDLNLPLVGKTLDSLRARKAKLEQREAQIETELAALQHRPIGKSDMYAKVDAFVEGLGQDYLSALAAFGSLTAIQNLPTLQPIPLDAPQFHFACCYQYPGEQANLKNQAYAIQRALCFFFPKEMKSGLRRAVDSLSFETAGPPLEKRNALANELQAELVVVRQQLRALLEEAAENGINL